MCREWSEGRRAGCSRQLCEAAAAPYKGWTPIVAHIERLLDSSRSRSLNAWDFLPRDGLQGGGVGQGETGSRWAAPDSQACVQVELGKEINFALGKWVSPVHHGSPQLGSAPPSLGDNTCSFAQTYSWLHVDKPFFDSGLCLCASTCSAFQRYTSYHGDIPFDGHVYLSASRSRPDVVQIVPVDPRGA